MQEILPELRKTVFKVPADCSGTELKKKKDSLSKTLWNVPYKVHDEEQDIKMTRGTI